MDSLGLLKDLLNVIYNHASNLPLNTRQEFIDFASQHDMCKDELKKDNNIGKPYMKEETNVSSANTHSKYDAENILLPMATKCVLISEKKIPMKTKEENVIQKDEYTLVDPFENDSKGTTNDPDYQTKTKENKRVKKRIRYSNAASKKTKSKKRSTIEIKSNPTSCDQCGDEMPKCKLYNHKLYKHGEKNFNCEQCGAKYFTKANLDTHMENHSSTKSTCTLCDSPPFTSTGLKQHIQRNHEEKKLLCSQCSFLASAKNIMNDHIQQKHTEKDKWPMCDECDYKHWDKHRVRRHFQKTHEGFRVQCEICTAMFTSTGNMHAHMKKKHRDILVETDIQNPHYPFKLRYIIPLKTKELSENQGDLALE